MLLLSSCLTGIVDRALETSANVVSGIKNLPSTVLPSQFESSVYIDGDYNIPNASIEVDGAYVVLRTFFATNRSVDENAQPYGMFGAGRGNDVTYGKSYVILRRSLDTFEIEPEYMIKMDIVDEPSEAATLSHNEIFSREDFSGDLNTAINRSDNNSVLIYVHGFNVSFEEAAIRSAQLSYDIGFSGTTVFFSWPARGEYPTYIADVESAQASQQYFESMINDVLYLTSANRIYLVAHGLGARLASRVMKSVLLTQPGFRSRVKELVLVAPDIDVNEFTEELVPYIATVDSPVTVYAFGDDSSMAISKSLSDGIAVGDNSEGVVLVSRVETIDAGGADASLAAHSGFSDTSSILADIWDLIYNGSRANSRRLLTARYTSEGTYWEYTQ